MNAPDENQPQPPKRHYLPFPMLRLARVNLANQLTLLRFAMVPVFIFLFLADWVTLQWAGFAEFLVACITDWMDGYVARKRGLVTNFGKIMDPLADKLLMTTALISLVQVRLVPGWMVAVILWRELAVTGLRTLAASNRGIMAADIWGKVKTVVQMVAVITGMIFYLTQNTLDQVLPKWRMETRHLSSEWGELIMDIVDSNAVVYWLMVVTAAISLTSGVAYFRKHWTLIAAELEEEDKVKL